MASVESQTFNKHKRSKEFICMMAAQPTQTLCHLPLRRQSAQITLTNVHLHWDRCVLESLEWV